MKKKEQKETRPVTHTEWVAVEHQESADKLDRMKSLEVQVGSCVVSVSTGFDKGLFIEVCQALLRL